MKIYLDYVFLINFLFDFILLSSESIILKINTTKKRIILASFFGAIFSFTLFLNMDKISFFFLKIITALILVIITFKYKDLKYTLTNLFYLMILSILLAGSLYLINIETSYTHNGLIFYKTNKTCNIIILLILSIITMYIYIKIEKKYKRQINTKYKVDIYLKNKTLHLNGFLDTGNTLVDYILKKPILIVNNNINIKEDKYIFTPYHTINGDGLLKCFIIDKIHIENYGYFYHVLIAISNEKLHLEGVDIILNNKLMEEIK